MSDYSAESCKETGYTVEYDKSVRLDAKTWESVEKDQHTTHNHAVFAALNSYSCHAPLSAASTYVVIEDYLYGVLMRAARMSATRMSAAAATRGGYKRDQIRLDSSKSKITLIGEEFVIAMRDGTISVKRFLHHAIYEVRGMALMWYCTQVSHITHANELDVAIQKFLQPGGKGRSYVNPIAVAEPSPAMIAELISYQSRMREQFPFNGIHLAIHNPDIIWHTVYDACLIDAPIQARQNQRNTIDILRKLKHIELPFLLLNRAPPGAGKSALLVPIAMMLQSRADELYVCAGQGRAGVIQFMQALYGAGIPFASVFIEEDTLHIVRQHSTRGVVCKVFVGTADAIHRLLRSSSRRGWVVIDEPTYGADIANSTACDDIMRLIAHLAPYNRRVIMFGATIPPITTLPNIVAHFSGRCAEVSGGTDSVQIACTVRTMEGVPILPHSGCCTALEVRNVIASVRTKPFFARMYTVESLVVLCDALNPATVPDLRTIFNSAQNLKPDVITDTTLKILDILATQDDATIARVASIVPQAYPPIIYGTLATTDTFDGQTMIVDIAPLEFVRHFETFLNLLRIRIPSVGAIYAKYDAAHAAIKSTAMAAESRKQKGLADGTLEDPPDDPSTIKFDFPGWGQIGTKAHASRFEGAVSSRMRMQYVPLCAVTSDLQLLLLAGIGILSSRAVACPVYAAEVWRRASQGQLAYVITDHSGCYGANMLLSRVIITEQFAALASIATLEQAGGRLCRVGLTYKGTLILPTNAITALLASIKCDGISTEAMNMEQAFLKYLG